ncbi:MAG: hypothetical protein M0Q91_12500 [Methanoregula sp.]|jgi:hypothetical protein|nr:hypothetical protein [Methanoregula sp.]
MTQTSFIPASEIPRLTTRLQQAFELDIEICSLQKEIKDREDRKQFIIEEHVNAGVLQDGPFSIKKKVTKRDSLDTEAFAEKYPAEFEELWRKIGQTKFRPSKAEASKVLTSDQVEKICKHTESVTYSIEWDPHQGAER